MSRRAIRLVLLCAALAGLLFVDVTLAENALRIDPDARSTAAQQPGANEVSIRAADGAALRAWMFQPPQPNGAAVILLHGASDTRRGALGPAQFLLRRGYTVLAPDGRGHGTSGGELVTYGLLEAGDVRRWSDWLAGRPGITRLFGIGESLGAAVLLSSLKGESRLQAVVAECPYSSFHAVAYDRLGGPFHIHGIAARLTLWPIVEPAFLHARLRYGLNLWDASPRDAVAASRVPILLIHGTADTNILPWHSRELSRVRPGIELWESEGVMHTGAYGANPVEFEWRVTEWFERRRSAN
ncbi:MAG: alpha/beta fold hydrolase [Acidobacteriota bacterium]|nr:alpha/beta fold hydrolase [Acidobacteriota bacterium]